MGEIKMTTTYKVLGKSEMGKSEDDLGKSSLPTTSFFKTPSSDLSSYKKVIDLNFIIDMKAEKDNLKVINFVSSQSGEGTSTVILNIIKIMLEIEKVEHVLVIDANQQHPSLHLGFDVPLTPGLNDVLWKKAKLSDVIYRIESSNIFLMPNGSALTSGPSNIEPLRYSTIFAQLSNKFRYIFIDSPPLLASTTSFKLASIADTTFVVIQAHRTQWEVATKAINYLKQYKCGIGGVILNRVLQPIPEWLYRRL